MNFVVKNRENFPGNLIEKCMDGGVCVCGCVRGTFEIEFSITRDWIELLAWNLAHTYSNVQSLSFVEFDTRFESW